MTTQLSPVGRFEKILLTTDSSEFSSGAEREAIKLAHACESQLHIMSVIKSTPEYDALPPQMLLEKAEKEANEAMERIKSQATAEGVPCETFICRGDDAFTEIVETAEEKQMDVIVMGRRGKKDLMRVMIGTSTAKVIGHAHCSVLVVPRAASIEGKHILLAVDGSRYSDMAAEATAKLAKQLKTSVTVLSVVYTDHKVERRQESETVVKRISEFLQQEGVQAEGQVAVGRQAKIIIETANTLNSDLIIVGSHGRTGLERILLGSVSERVIGLADCAVLVVKA